MNVTLVQYKHPPRVLSVSLLVAFFDIIVPNGYSELLNFIWYNGHKGVTAI